MTGLDTKLRVANLSLTAMETSLARYGGTIAGLVDTDPGDEFGKRKPYNLVVLPNPWGDLQGPRCASHQFNSDGPRALFDSIHPEESIETPRKEASGYSMIA